MERHIHNSKDGLIRVEEADPVCGEAFCDHCGDCLYCSHDDFTCWDGSDYLWIVYEE